MALSEEQIKAIMAYCREDSLSPPEKDNFRETCLGQVSYLRGAGVPPPCEGVVDPTPKQLERQAQYDLALKALVLDAWDHRDAVFTGHIVAENPALRRTINQLKLSGGGPV